MSSALAWAIIVVLFAVTFAAGYWTRARGETKAVRSTGEAVPPAKGTEA